MPLPNDSLQKAEASEGSELVIFDIHSTLLTQLPQGWAADQGVGRWYLQGGKQAVVLIQALSRAGVALALASVTTQGEMAEYAGYFKGHGLDFSHSICGFTLEPTDELAASKVGKAAMYRYILDQENVRRHERKEAQLKSQQCFIFEDEGTTVKYAKRFYGGCCHVRSSDDFLLGLKHVLDEVTYAGYADEILFLSSLLDVLIDQVVANQAAEDRLFITSILDQVLDRVSDELFDLPEPSQRPQLKRAATVPPLSYCFFSSLAPEEPCLTTPTSIGQVDSVRSIRRSSSL